jgi:AraC-like DNA-binding protein
MKPFFEKIPKPPAHSFYVKRETVLTLDMPFHYHPEFELTLTENGNGKRFIGNSVEQYGEGDLVFIGKNLPHCFLEDTRPVDSNAILPLLTVVQFEMEIFGTSFLDLPECAQLKKLIQLSQQGLQIYGATNERIKEMMIAIHQVTQMDKLIILLKILKTLSISKEYRLLSSRSFTHQYRSSDYYRLNKVYNFIIQNFKENIDLKEASRTANLSETAFCRFFKKRTLKTFKEVVIEMRINYACDLIGKNKLQELTMPQIAEASGFNNLSNFNRQFKKLMGRTPSAYAKELEY